LRGREEERYTKALSERKKEKERERERLESFCREVCPNFFLLPAPELICEAFEGGVCK